MTAYTIPGDRLAEIRLLARPEVQRSLQRSHYSWGALAWYGAASLTLWGALACALPHVGAEMIPCALLVALAPLTPALLGERHLA